MSAAELRVRLKALREIPVKVTLEYRDPSDIRNVFGIVGACEVRNQQLGKIAELIAEAEQTDTRLCGNCDHWMKSRICPREHNVNGYSRGPSCNDFPCAQFQMKQWVIDLKQQRLTAAEQEIAALEAKEQE